MAQVTHKENMIDKKENNQAGNAQEQHAKPTPNLWKVTIHNSSHTFKNLHPESCYS